MSTNGRTQILSYWYIPENAKAVVRICHGMSEHIGRKGYDAFASYLESKGYAVCAHDYIGHGGSSKKEELGFFGEKNGVEYLLGDVGKLGRLASKKLPGKKHILMGHSMGSLIARKYLAEHPGEAACGILMGTLGPMPVAPMAKGLAGFVASACGARGYSRLLYKLSFGSYLDRIPDPKSQNAWLSTIEKEVEAYDEDPLCGFLFTNAAMRDLIRIYAGVSEKGWADKLDKNTPLLFVSGSEDPCGAYEKGVKEIYSRVIRAGVPAELKLYKEARHELLNESCKEKVYEDILAFIEKHAGGNEI